MADSYRKLPLDLPFSAFHNLDEPVRVWDSQLNLVLANKAASDEQGAPISIMFSRLGSRSTVDEGQQTEKDLVRRTFKELSRQKTEITGIDSNGDRWVTEIRTKPLYEPTGKVNYVVATFLDRSPEKRLERQLL